MADLKREFGARVRFLRQRAGLSQEKLAGKAGLHTTYISGVERGEYNVSLQNIAKLARALDTPIPELFSGETAPATPSEAERLRTHILKVLQRQGVAKLRTISNVVKELTKGRS